MLWGVCAYVGSKRLKDEDKYKCIDNYTSINNKYCNTYVRKLDKGTGCGTVRSDR